MVLLPSIVFCSGAKSVFSNCSHVSLFYVTLSLPFRVPERGRVCLFCPLLVTQVPLSPRTFNPTTPLRGASSTCPSVRCYSLFSQRSRPCKRSVAVFFLFVLSARHRFCIAVILALIIWFSNARSKRGADVPLGT